MPKANPPYSITWRPMAETDLDNIIDYIAQDNPVRAEEFGQELRNAAAPLAQHPALGRTGRPGLPAGVREFVVHRHYILLYRVLAKARVVDILAVKHTAQQL